MPSFLVIIGPSACGKSSVVRELHRRGVVRVHPTWTTRPRRPDEVAADGDAVAHRFVSDEAFSRLDASGFFVDTVEMFGLPYRYGLPHLVRAGGGAAVDAVMLRAPLVARFTAVVPDFVVYQIEDDPDRARDRLLARGTTADDVAARLDDNHREALAGREIAHRHFVNSSTIGALADAIEDALDADIVAPDANLVGAR